VTYIPNSIEARDVASFVHPQTNLRKHQEEGPWPSRAEAVTGLFPPA
jgi:hypothetical protein